MQSPESFIRSGIVLRQLEHDLENKNLCDSLIEFHNSKYSDDSLFLDEMQSSYCICLKIENQVYFQSDIDLISDRVGTFLHAWHASRAEMNQSKEISDVEG